MSKLNQLFIKYGNWVVKYRIPIFLLSIVASIAIGSGGNNLGFDNNYRTFFGKNNPQLQAFEKLQNVYTKVDNLLIAIEPKDGNVFTKETLATIEEYTEKAWQFPYSTRVDSLTNYQHTYVEEDDLIVENLLENAESLTQSDFNKAKQIAINEPILTNRLITEKANITGILVTLSLDDDNPNGAIEAAVYGENFAKEIEASNPNLKTYISGTAALSNAFSQSSMRDMGTLTPIMSLIIIVVMGLILRSFTATFVSVFVILFSAMIGMGLAGWVGLKITGPSSTAPTIILTLAIADSIHILVSIIQSIKEGMSKHEAIVEGLRINMKPVFLTSLTTVIGFLSLNFSDAPPIHDLGNITAVGVIAAWLISILFLPAAIAIFPMKVKVDEGKQNSLLNKLSDFVINKRKPLFALLIVLTGALYMAMTQIQLNDEFVKYFDTSTKFRRDADHVSKNLTGIYQIEFSLDTKEDNGINHPVYLKKLVDFKDWFEAQENVIHVSSFTDIMKRLNKTMHYDRDEYYTVPNQQDLAAQYLLLYEMSLPFGLDLNNQINIDKSSTRFTVTLENTSTVRIRQLTAQAEQWLEDNAPNLKTEASSPAIMFSHISERNINSMMKGISIALILITICLTISLRSFKYGLLSIIPNVVPLIFAFGIWGLTVQQIGFAAAIVASVNIGIVVDDTVHFLTKYVRARTEEGLSPQDATRYAFSTVGVALIATSVFLILGFAVLTQSSFLINNSMGILSVITISAALIADLLFLPPLLILFEEKFSKDS